MYSHSEIGIHIKRLGSYFRGVFKNMEAGNDLGGPVIQFLNGNGVGVSFWGPPIPFYSGPLLGHWWEGAKELPYHTRNM